MMKLCCECFYNGQCKFEEEEVCEDYMSYTDFESDNEVECLINERRYEFYEAWNKYIEEYED